MQIKRFYYKKSTLKSTLLRFYLQKNIENKLSRSETLFLDWKQWIKIGNKIRRLETYVDSGSKWTVQKGESGRPLNWDKLYGHLSQRGRSFGPKWTVMKFRTRTLIFLKTLNTNEHEHVFPLNYWTLRTRTNTNTRVFSSLGLCITVLFFHLFFFTMWVSAMKWLIQKW